MTAILTLLASKAGTYIIGGLAVLAAFIATYVKGRLSGAALERNAQKAKEAEANEQHLEDISKASSARNSVDSRLPDSDPYRRD